MEPFSKDDPLYDLLGKSRKAEPRTNFTQDVMRSIRHTPQRRSWWEKIHDFFGELSMPRAACAAVVMAGFVMAALWISREQGTTTVVFVEPPASGQSLLFQAENSEPESPQDTSVLSELNSMDEFSDLLASQDTSSLTDGEIAMLLY